MLEDLKYSQLPRRVLVSDSLFKDKTRGRSRRSSLTRPKLLSYRAVTEKLIRSMIFMHCDLDYLDLDQPTAPTKEIKLRPTVIGYNSCLYIVGEVSYIDRVYKSRAKSSKRGCMQQIL